MTHEELQKLRERLLQASQLQPHSRLQRILDKLLNRVESMVESEEEQLEPVSADHSEKVA